MIIRFDLGALSWESTRYEKIPVAHMETPTARWLIALGATPYTNLMMNMQNVNIDDYIPPISEPYCLCIEGLETTPESISAWLLSPQTPIQRRLLNEVLKHLHHHDAAMEFKFHWNGCVDVLFTQALSEDEWHHKSFLREQEDDQIIG